MSTARNVAIIVVIAAAVWALPGGGDAAEITSAIVGTLFNVALVWIGWRLYLQYRTAIFGLGDEHRGLLYGGIGLAVVAMAARDRLFDLTGGVLVWLALIAGASIALFAVWRHWREYA